MVVAIIEESIGLVETLTNDPDWSEHGWVPNDIEGITSARQIHGNIDTGYVTIDLIDREDALSFLVVLAQVRQYSVKYDDRRIKTVAECMTEKLSPYYPVNFQIQGVVPEGVAISAMFVWDCEEDLRSQLEIESLCNMCTNRALHYAGLGFILLEPFRKYWQKKLLKASLSDELDRRIQLFYNDSDCLIDQ